MTPRGPIVLGGLFPRGWAEVKSHRMHLENSPEAGKTKWSMGPAPLLPSIRKRSRDKSCCSSNRKPISSVMSLQRKVSAPLPPISQAQRGHLPMSCSQKQLSRVMDLQRKFGHLTEELIDRSFNTPSNDTDVDDKILEYEAICCAIRKLRWTRPGLISILTGSQELPPRSQSSPLGSRDRPPESMQRAKGQCAQDPGRFEAEPHRDAPSVYHSLHNKSPVGFCQGEIRCRQDPFCTRGTLRAHKATVPKKGQIKVTAMDYEMENPEYYNKPTVDHQNSEKKQRKRRPRTGKSYLINRPEIVDQIREGDKQLAEEKVKGTLREGGDDLSSYTVRDLTSLLNFTDHAPGKKAAYLADRKKHEKTTASSPVFRNGVKLSTGATTLVQDQTAISSGSWHSPIGLTQSSSYIERGMVVERRTPKGVSSDISQTSPNLFVVPSQTPVVPTQTPCVPQSSPGVPIHSPVNAGYTLGAYFVNSGGHSLPPATVSIPTACTNRLPRGSHVTRCGNEALTFTPSVQGQAVTAWTKKSPSYSPNAQKYVLTSRDSRVYPPISSTAPNVSTLGMADTHTHGGHRKCLRVKHMS